MLQVGAYDDAATREEKEKTNNTEKELSVFKKNKSRIENLFLSKDSKTGDPLYSEDMISKEIDTILGKDGRNLFIDELISVLGMERKMMSIQKRMSDGNLRMDDLKRQMSVADENSKKDIQDRIKNAEKDSNNLEQELSTLSIDFKKRQEEFRIKMATELDKMKKSVTRLNNTKAK
jgi:hypothetical protein